MEEAFACSKLVPPPRETTRRIVGLSLVEAMRALHPEGDDDAHVTLAEAYKTAFQKMRQQGTVHEPLFEGIAETLDALDAAGWLLGIATGKSDRGLAAILDTHGLGARFVTLHTADRHPSKPHPSMVEACIAEAGAAPETTAVIGDTSFDMAMAKAAGALAVGVSWGYHPAKDLAAAGADLIVDTPAAILNALKEIA